MRKMTNRETEAEYYHLSSKQGAYYALKYHIRLKEVKTQKGEEENSYCKSEVNSQHK